MVDLKKLTKDVNKITAFKYLRTHKARDPIIRQVAKDLTDAKKFALGEKDNEELVKAHDALVDKINNFYNDDYIKKNPGKVLVFPRLKKADSEEPNVVETIQVNSKGEYGVLERQLASDTPAPEVAEPKVVVEEKEEVKEEGELKDSKEDEIEVKDVEEMDLEDIEDIDVQEMDLEDIEDVKEDSGSKEEKEMIEEIKKRGDYDEEDIKEIEKIVKDEMGTHKMPDGTVMTGKTHNKFSVPVVEKIQDIPLSNIMIPPELLGVEGKSARQLSKEIKFLLQKYPSMLKQEVRRYRKADKKNLRQMKDIHSRIIGILKPEVDDVKKGKTIGIVLDAEKYLDDKINEILARKTIESLRPADLVEITQEPKKVGREVGSFAIVKDRSGKPSAERAPVYRSIPTTNEMKPMSRTARISQASIKSNVGNRPVDIAKMDVRNNPFAREQKSKRFDIVL
jgi:hypothetical protein